MKSEKDESSAILEDQELQIGARLRQARKSRGLSLKRLAEAANCSPSLISKIENEKARPSLHMLHAIVGQLGLSIATLFAERHSTKGVVQRKGARPLLSMSNSPENGVVLECLVPEGGGEMLYGSIHIVKPGGGGGGAISHVGEEVGYILEGSIELTVDGVPYLLESGDSFYFKSDKPHSYKNAGSVQARVVWFNSPPTF